MITPKIGVDTHRFAIGQTFDSSEIRCTLALWIALTAITITLNAVQ